MQLLALVLAQVILISQSSATKSPTATFVLDAFQTSWDVASMDPTSIYYGNHDEAVYKCGMQMANESWTRISSPDLCRVTSKDFVLSSRSLELQLLPMGEGVYFQSLLQNGRVYALQGSTYVSFWYKMVGVGNDLVLIHNVH